MVKFKNICGFTLVEIMIVVAIISLLAIIAIPNLLRARHNANEAAAIAGLRTIGIACGSFNSTQTPRDYPASMAVLGNAVPPYIDNKLRDAISAATARQGYYYTYARTDQYRFTCIATPAVSGTSGTRVFFVDESGIIRLNGSTGDPIE